MGSTVKAGGKGDMVNQIAEGITQLIINGEYAPGAPLREVELCSRFSSSRTPVREALRILQNNGLARYIPRCGVRVNTLEPADLTHMTDIRTVLETLSTREAAKYVTDQDIAELRRIDREFLEAHDTKMHHDLDRELHFMIAKISRNDILQEFLDSLYSRQSMIFCMIPFKEERIPFSYQEHENIIDALEMHDAELAAKQADIHFQMSQRSLQDKLEQYFKDHPKTKKRRRAKGP